MTIKLKMSIYAAMVLLFLLPAAHASLKSWDVDISINSDKTSEWVIKLVYDEPVPRTDYFVLAKITGVEVSVDSQFVDCDVSAKDVGTSITCLGISGENITYRFRALGLINDFQGLNIFSYRFAAIWLVDNLTIAVKLPLGTGLVERAKLEKTSFMPFEPFWGKEGSDGRRIFIVWSQERPRLGTTTDVSVIYENILENQILSLGIIAVLAAGFLLVMYIMRKRPMRDILPVLTDAERKVMQILLREKKPVDQRLIVKEADFSKSKVSRIISDLENRGLIERIPKGRTNLIRLGAKKELKTDSTPPKNIQTGNQ
ncbi:MAG: hypothetical protein HYT72_05540 [Candidatus Aenigmarchaeota archaeon]|nr:hypothetical protein [Candidatus Aenigmarchaeota archaeon]